MSMEPKIVAYARVHWTEAGVVADAAYNCSVADAGSGVGDIDVTIGEGGVDRTLCQIVVTPDLGDTTAASTIHTSDTVKRIQFRADDGSLETPDGAWIEIKRLPPLPAP